MPNGITNATTVRAVMSAAVVIAVVGAAAIVVVVVAGNLGPSKKRTSHWKGLCGESKTHQITN